MRIGIDLGGTKTEIVVLGADGEVVIRKRRPTPHNDYAATVATITGLVTDTESKLGVKCTVGVCIPGAISHRTGTVKNANSTWLNGQPLDRDLAVSLSRPIRCENDANCLSLSEATDGSASGSRVVFAVIIGTAVVPALSSTDTCIGAQIRWLANGDTISWRGGRPPTNFPKGAIAGANIALKCT